MTGDQTLGALQELLDIMATLRSEQGCRWDRQQTPESLKPYILEECYELLEAIDHARPQEICDELGDLLLQVVFQAQIFSEQGAFSIREVAQAICAKLIRRHPHIFARASHEGHEQRWEDIKLQERRERGQSVTLADRIPKILPALKRAQKISKRLAPEESYDLIAETELKLRQLKNLSPQSPSAADRQREIIGALLFNISHLANNFRLDAEECLRQTNAATIAKIEAEK